MRKSKKFAAIIAAALVFAIAVPLFAACTPRTDGGEHSQHDYDPASGVWEWNDDLTEAYYVLACLDAGCGHVERMSAAVRDISGADRPTCTEGGARRARASVILDGRGHIDEESKEMGALGHSIEDKADTGYHWRECSRCGLVENRAEHAFGPFTCDVNGHSRVCAECGYVHSGRHSNDIFDTCTICGFEGGNENGGGTGDNPSKPNLTQTSTALPAVIKNIYHTYKNVKFDGTAPIGIDAAIGVVVDGVTYGLFAKGNLDLTKSNTEDKTEFYIGLDKKDGARENLFSLAYDVPSIDTPYLYVGSSSAGYFKTNGLSISEMLYDFANQQHADDAAVTSAETAEEEEGVDLIETIAELVGGLLGNAIFGSTAQMNQSATGGVQYVFTLDVQYMLSAFGSQIESLLGLVKQFVGDSIDLDAYIGPVVDGIASLLPEEDKTAIVGTPERPVTDASTKLGNLFKVLAKKMGNASDAKANNIVIKLTFDFNQDNTFAGAVIDVDASKFVAGLNATASEEDKIDFDGKVQIMIDKLVISNNAVSDPFSEADAELKALIADTDAEAHNFLDFDFEATAEGDDDSYVIKADFDLDPFALTEMAKYSDMTKGEDGNYAPSAAGQAFWKEKMAAALASMGTATVLIAKEGFTGSTFDGTVEGVDSKSVIVYAEIDESGIIDVFVWDPVNNEEVSFGALTFPLTWSELVDKLTRPVQASSSSNGRYSDPYYESIATVCRTVGQILALLDPFFSEIEIDEATGTLTLGYASVIENVVWPILDIFVAEADSGWIDANLNNLLAAIFGSVTEGVADPADSVTFTLESLSYCGKAIYPAAE